MERKDGRLGKAHLCRIQSLERSCETQTALAVQEHDRRLGLLEDTNTETLPRGILWSPTMLPPVTDFHPEPPNTGPAVELELTTVLLFLTTATIHHGDAGGGTRIFQTMIHRTMGDLDPWIQGWEAEIQAKTEVSNTMESMGGEEKLWIDEWK